MSNTKDNNSNLKNLGWIAVYRQLLENPIVRKPKYFLLWIVLLLKAAHTGHSFIWNAKKQIIRTGQILTGREKLSEATGIKPSTVENILKYLESEQQIEQQKTPKFRIITIINWEKYQFKKKLDSKVDNRMTTDEQQNDTYNNDDNGNNDKKKSPLLQIFDFWNKFKGCSVCKKEKKITWHSHKRRPDETMAPDIERAVAGALKDGHPVDEICGAIDNFAKVLLGVDYYWSYPWTLPAFLTRGEERHKEAARKWWRFLPDNFIEENYLTEAARRKRTEAVSGPRPYELAKQQSKQERGNDEQRQTA
jgi:hypothetical protein